MDQVGEDGTDEEEDSDMPAAHNPPICRGRDQVDDLVAIRAMLRVSVGAAGLTGPAPYVVYLVLTT
jgi:hypothetical protein